MVLNNPLCSLSLTILKNLNKLYHFTYELQNKINYQKRFLSFGFIPDQIKVIIIEMLTTNLKLSYTCSWMLLLYLLDLSWTLYLLIDDITHIILHTDERNCRDDLLNKLKSAGRGFLTFYKTYLEANTHRKTWHSCFIM